MSTEAMRKSFEVWAVDQCVLHRQDTGRYSSTITQFAWEAWQEHAGIVSELRARNAELEAQLAESRANDRTAMAYLSEIRDVVGGNDFPDMVQRISHQEALIKTALDAAAEKCEDEKGSGCVRDKVIACDECAEAIRQITPQQVMERMK